MIQRCAICKLTRAEVAADRLRATSKVPASAHPGTRHRWVTPQDGGQ